MKQEPLVVCAVTGADDVALNMCKDWIKDNGYTSETHRLMRGATMTWVEVKCVAERN